MLGRQAFRSGVRRQPSVWATARRIRSRSPCRREGTPLRTPPSPRPTARRSRSRCATPVSPTTPQPSTCTPSTKAASPTRSGLTDEDKNLLARWQPVVGRDRSRSGGTATLTAIDYHTCDLDTDDDLNAWLAARLGLPQPASRRGAEPVRHKLLQAVREPRLRRAVWSEQPPLGRPVAIPGSDGFLGYRVGNRQDGTRGAQRSRVPGQRG